MTNITNLVNYIREITWKTRFQSNPENYTENLVEFKNFKEIINWTLTRNRYHDDIYYQTAISSFSSFFDEINPDEMDNDIISKYYRIIGHFLTSWGAIGDVVTGFSIRKAEVIRLLKKIYAVGEFLEKFGIMTIEDILTSPEYIREVSEQTINVYGLSTTGLCKVLHLAFPKIFIPIDDEIQNQLGRCESMRKKLGWGKKRAILRYDEYLIHIGDLFEGYNDELSDIAKKYNRPLLYTLDKYYWITAIRKRTYNDKIYPFTYLNEYNRCVVSRCNIQDNPPSCICQSCGSFHHNTCIEKKNLFIGSDKWECWYCGNENYYHH